MHHTHFNSIASTQLYLKQNLEHLQKSDRDVLISASNQTAGKGRLDHAWDFYSRSIAMSFTLRPHTVATLTPIEIALLCIEYFHHHQVSILLKWPNDLMTTEGKKCGGILTQYVDTQTVIAGLGLNLGSPSDDLRVPDSYKHGLGFVSLEKMATQEMAVLCEEIYAYMLGNRLSTVEEVIEKFNAHCCHMQKLVLMDDESLRSEGRFLGIGRQGEALIENAGQVKSYFSSSLKILG